MEFTGGLATYLLERVIFRSYGVEGGRWNLEGRGRDGGLEGIYSVDRDRRENTGHSRTNICIWYFGGLSHFVMLSCVYSGEGKNGKEKNFSPTTTSIVGEREFLSVDTSSDCDSVPEACTPKRVCVCLAYSVFVLSPVDCGSL